MRVALLTNFIPPYRKPLFEALRAEVGELRILVSTTMEGGRAWDVDWGDLDVVRQRTVTLNRVWRTARFSEGYELHIPVDTIGQLRRYRPDVILTGEMGARSLQATLYGQLTRTPTVLWATLSDHLEQHRGGVRRTVRCWLARNAAHVIVNGASGAQYMRRLGMSDERLRRVPYVTDMSRLLELPLRPQTDGVRELLFVGALSERKGITLLIAAARALDAASARLTIVGDGPLRDEVAAAAAASGSKIRLLGSVPYADLPRVFAGSDVLVFPTLGDEWGLVVNEALAAGVPVLGSRYAQSVEQLIVDGENGWVFTPDDEASMTAALDRVLATPAAMLQEMRVKARESIRSLTPQHAAQEIAALLREVVRKP